MRRNLVYCLLAITLVSCRSCGPKPQNKHLNYKNIVILSDMSTRLTNKPQKDIPEIFSILDYFKNECVKPGEKIGDKSSIRFSVFSGKVATTIDINDIKHLSDKQSFINSTGKFKADGLEKKLDEFKKTVTSIYSSVHNPGLDLISMLTEKIQNEPIIKLDTSLTNGIDTTFINYDNDIYIFTDGYLEYKNHQLNPQFYFGDENIERIRRYCSENKVDVSTALKRDKTLGLPPYFKEKNKNVVLHIMETHERDKDEILQSYRHPDGLRDNEILEAVWKKWAKESGFKDLSWNKY
jgi:hypothetical protein